MARPRILVVDPAGSDDALVDAVRQHRRWRVALAGADDAVSLAASAWVVVAIDDAEGRGLRALRAVRQSGSAASRILVFEPAVAARVVARGEPAHQVVMRPALASKLRAAIERAIRVRELVEDETLGAVAASLGTLPAQPRTWVSLCELLDSDTATMKDAADLVERDVGVAAKVMQLVNSGMFQRSRPVGSLFQALQLLGLGIVRDLVLCVEVVHLVGPVQLPVEISPIDHQTNTRAIAMAARTVAPRAAVDVAFTAGLLQSLGRLLFATRAPTLYTEVVQRVMRGEPADRAELRVFGVDSRAFSAWMLANWGLPHEVVEAVRWCDQPERASGRGAPLALSVYLAQRLVHELAVRETTGEELALVSASDLAPWGLSGALGGWRDTVAEIYDSLRAGGAAEDPPIVVG
ncbi:MAG: HDOD domain-containing protein [Myxococcota bacterium]